MPPITIMLQILYFILALPFTLMLTGAAAVLVAYLYVEPTLPETEQLRSISMQEPLQIFTQEGRLIGEFGEMHREPMTKENTPKQLIEAFLAAEDDRFFEHPGVDYQGLLRAGLELIRTGRKNQGGSTITMQVARNFFLSSEKTFLRKISEIFLALRIEQSLTKEEILNLYLNKIYMGHRAYGVGAAARIYYGKRVDELSLAEVAMIAGLPKAPSVVNPISNPQRASQRRDYVLDRMQKLGFISETEYQEATQVEDKARLRQTQIESEAPYIAEMARAEVVNRYGDEIAYNNGLRVFVTVEDRLQSAANLALRNALISYDERHGYRGAEKQVQISQDPETWKKSLEGMIPLGGLIPGVVTQVSDKQIQVYLVSGQKIAIDWSGLNWARRKLDINRVGKKPDRASEITQIGSVIRVRQIHNEKSHQPYWMLAQLPEAEASFVALSSLDGRIMALSGGFDFKRSKFNRVTQATRQPGSSFKPFIYSAGIDKGMTASTILNDSPLTMTDSRGNVWKPENYDETFHGPIRLRVALTFSRNLASIRLLEQIGVNYTLDYLNRFGFETKKLPSNLTLALGTGEVTPLQLTSSYAIFANNGFRVSPYFIDRIEDRTGEIIWQAQPTTACPSCALGKADLVPNEFKAEQVIPPATAYVMSSIMQDVIRYGTARRALVLHRKDLAGKTGTTNDFRDAWFCGFNPDITATAWIGYDQGSSLGRSESGGKIALPMWIDFMQVALEDIVDQGIPKPENVTTAKIDPTSGLLAPDGSSQGVSEVFVSGTQPTGHAQEVVPEVTEPAVTEQLF